ncbi:MAG TPA: SRPBCC domain-containing protein [Polyangiaceae bacterium]|nr:SRPBCC domain-containing protein [Polyangiaceae bacterium]
MELRAEVEIHAPPEAVFRVLTDFARYPEWNPFIVEISGRPAVGERLHVVISPPGGREMTFRPKVLAAEPNQELRWLGHFLVRGLFDGEHFFRLVPVGADKTRFVQGEDFRGLLVKPMTHLLTNTARGFVFMNQALKKRVESGPT